MEGYEFYNGPVYTCVCVCACVCVCVCVCVSPCIVDALGVSTVCYPNYNSSGVLTITIGNICARSSDLHSFTVLHCCWYIASWKCMLYFETMFSTYSYVLIMKIFTGCTVDKHM